MATIAERAALLAENDVRPCTLECGCFTELVGSLTDKQLLMLKNKKRQSFEGSLNSLQETCYRELYRFVPIHMVLIKGGPPLVQ